MIHFTNKEIAINMRALYNFEDHVFWINACIDKVENNYNRIDLLYNICLQMGDEEVIELLYNFPYESIKLAEMVVSNYDYLELSLQSIEDIVLVGCIFSENLLKSCLYCTNANIILLALNVPEPRLFQYTDKIIKLMEHEDVAVSSDALEVIENLTDLGLISTIY